MMPSYFYAGLRAGHGYEPGDEVSKEFAEAYPGLVTEIVPIPEPLTGQAFRQTQGDESETETGEEDESK